MLVVLSALFESCVFNTALPLLRDSAAEVGGLKAKPKTEAANPKGSVFVFISLLGSFRLLIARLLEMGIVWAPLVVGLKLFLAF